jgi:hypothetical protein
MQVAGLVISPDRSLPSSIAWTQSIAPTPCLRGHEHNLAPKRRTYAGFRDASRRCRSIRRMRSSSAVKASTGSTGTKRSHGSPRCSRRTACWRSLTASGSAPIRSVTTCEPCTAGTVRIPTTSRSIQSKNSSDVAFLSASERTRRCHNTGRQRSMNSSCPAPLHLVQLVCGVG